MLFNFTKNFWFNNIGNFFESNWDLNRFSHDWTRRIFVGLDQCIDHLIACDIQLTEAPLTISPSISLPLLKSSFLAFHYSLLPDSLLYVSYCHDFSLLFSLSLSLSLSLDLSHLLSLFTSFLFTGSFLFNLLVLTPSYSHSYFRSHLCNRERSWL